MGSVSQRLPGAKSNAAFDEWEVEFNIVDALQMSPIRRQSRNGMPGQAEVQ
jgi:hypothetical protein